MIWTTSFGKGSQSPIVVDGLLSALRFCLLIHLLLLSGIVLLFQGFHVPLMLLLPLQFILLSLVLQSFHVPLMLLLSLQFILLSLVLQCLHLPLPLQFGHVSLVLQSFSIMINLPLCIIL
jgi:hypothetical protein